MWQSAQVRRLRACWPWSWNGALGWTNCDGLQVIELTLWHWVQVCDSCPVTCDGCGAPIEAKISYIARQAEYTPPVLYTREQRSKLVFLIEALPAPADATRLKPGQPVDVTLK